MIVPGQVGKKHSDEEMSRRNLLFIGVAGAAAIAGGGYLINDMMRPYGLDADDAITEHWIGGQDAKVRMITYVSYTCGHCAAFHRATWNGLKRDFIDTRKVKFTIREVLFHRYDLWASMLGRELGRRGYFDFADELLERQGQWVSDLAEETQENLRYMALRHGLSEARIDKVLKAEVEAEKLAGWVNRNVKRDRVKSTPTLIIDGRTYGNMLYPQMKDLLEAAIV